MQLGEPPIPNKVLTDSLKYGLCLFIKEALTVSLFAYSSHHFSEVILILDEQHEA